MKKYICIDIGGTAVKYGIITENAALVTRKETPTEAYKGGPGVLEKVIKITSQLCRDNAPISGICISTAGVVDPGQGMILHAGPAIPDYSGLSYKKVLEQRFQIPCEVENDVNCAGLAEFLSGAGTGGNPMLMLTVGTGIGGCLITDGQIFHGNQNYAMEIGYMRMRGSDFQTLGSASALTKKIAERKREPEEYWNGYRIFQEAKQDDAVCIQAIDEMADILGLGIANICYVASPQTVVLGGGIMSQKEYLKDKIQLAVNKYLIDSIASHTKIAFAVHGNDAGMLGAFYHFISRAKGWAEWNTT